MKPFLIDLAKTIVNLGYDLVRVADSQIFYLENGKTYKQALKEALAATHVSAYDAKVAHEASKKGVN